MPSVREVLGRLAAEGVVSDGLVEQGGDAPPPPWYVRLLTALGAWFAALCLVLFAVAVDLVDNAAGSLFMGLLLLGGSVGLNRGVARDAWFVQQMALAFGLAGQALVLAGLFDGHENLPGLGLVVINTLLLGVYRHPVQSFLSALLWTLGAAWLCFERDLPEALHGVVVLLAAAGAWLWLRLPRPPWLARLDFWQPLAYGMWFGVLDILLLAILPFAEEVPRWWLSSLGIAGVWLFVLFRLLPTLGLEPASPAGLLSAAAALLLCALAWHTPGLPAALLCLALGFYLGDRLLMGVAVGFLAVFLSAYYYHLELSLLSKSLVLAGSGGFLLLLRALLKSLPGEAE